MCNVASSSFVCVGRSKTDRNLKRKAPNYVDEKDSDDDLSEDDVHSLYLSGSDGENQLSDEEGNPYVPKKNPKLEHNTASNILSVNSGNNIQSSTPKRGRGRPPGAKNKHSKNRNMTILPKSNENWMHGKSRKRGKKGKANNKSVSNDNAREQKDDKENIPSEAHIAEFKEQGSMASATGVVSPVKKKSPKKSRKIIANPQNWVKNKLKLARNSGKEYEYVSRRYKVIKTKKAAEIGPPCKCMKKCTETLNNSNPDIIPTVFKHYWELGNYNLQTADIISKTNHKKKTAKEI